MKLNLSIIHPYYHQSLQEDSSAVGVGGVGVNPLTPGVYLGRSDSPDRHTIFTTEHLTNRNLVYFSFHSLREKKYCNTAGRIRLGLVFITHMHVSDEYLSKRSSNIKEGAGLNLCLAASTATGGEKWKILSHSRAYRLLSPLITGDFKSATEC